MKAICQDCEKTYRVFKNDKLCPLCEQEEWERMRAKGAAPRRSMRPRSLAGKVEPIKAPAAQPRPTLAMRLFGKRAAAG